MSKDGTGQPDPSAPNPFSREGASAADDLGHPLSGDLSKDPGTAPRPAPEGDWPGYPLDRPEPGPAPDPYAPTSYPQTPYPHPDPYPAAPYPAAPYPAYGTPYGTPYGVAPQHPQAVTALVLGLVGLTVCPPVGVGGIISGLRVRRDSDANPGQFSGRGMGTAALILGIVSVVVTVFWIALIVTIFVTDYS